MFPFKLLEVYYIKDKKSGKRSGNIMVQKLNKSALGTRSRDSGVRALLRYHLTTNKGFDACKGIFYNYII